MEITPAFTNGAAVSFQALGPGRLFKVSYWELWADPRVLYLHPPVCTACKTPLTVKNILFH